MTDHVLLHFFPSSTAAAGLSHWQTFHHTTNSQRPTHRTARWHSRYLLLLVSIHRGTVPYTQAVKIDDLAYREYLQRDFCPSTPQHTSRTVVEPRFDNADHQRTTLCQLERRYNRHNSISSHFYAYSVH